MSLTNILVGGKQLLSMGALPYFAGVALAVFIAGGMGAWKVRGKIDDGRVARAENALIAYKADVSKAIADQATKQVAIRDDVRKYQDETNAYISTLSSDVRNLSSHVRVCESVSTLILAKPAQGADGPGESGQPRPAQDVLAELATQLAETADRNAAQLNALIEWVERTGK